MGFAQPPVEREGAPPAQGGHERDALPDGTNIDYMHFRFYGASIGRFQKPDSIMGSLANPQSFNLYPYVKGNPVNYNDPTGHLYRLAGGGAGHRSNSMPYSQPFVDRSVDLDDYLWGGAELAETVTHWTKTDSNGKVLDWGCLAPGNVAPSTPSGKAAEAWLDAIGVPRDQQANVIGKLAQKFRSVGMGPELAIAIVVNKKTGVYDVMSAKATGEIGQAMGSDLVNLAKKAVDAGYSVAAMGHAHMPTGSPNFLVDATGQTKTAEGASVADATGYHDEFVAKGVPADRLFVLASDHVFVFGGDDSFVSYTWKP